MISTSKPGRLATALPNAFNKQKFLHRILGITAKKEGNLYEGKANAAVNLGGQVKGYAST